jgi:hypothetical protein
MEPLGFFLGVITFGAAVVNKKALRKAAVFTTSLLISSFENLRTSAFEMKEELEDVVAEAKYENMKKHSETTEASEASENPTLN